MVTDESDVRLSEVPIHCTRMRLPRVGLGRLLAFVAALTTGVWADPKSVQLGPASQTSGNAPQPPAAPPARPSWDLDGTYIWLGPAGAAVWSDTPRRAGESSWDSAFGADLSVIRVAEREPVAALGGSLGASRTSRRDSRLWFDAVIGTRIWGYMVGAAAGPVIALSNDRRPQLGASFRLWGYAGIAPYARIGFVSSTAFVELGVQLPLPVFRR